MRVRCLIHQRKCGQQRVVAKSKAPSRGISLAFGGEIAVQLAVQQDYPAMRRHACKRRTYSLGFAPRFIRSDASGSQLAIRAFVRVPRRAARVSGQPTSWRRVYRKVLENQPQQQEQRVR